MTLQLLPVPLPQLCLQLWGQRAGKPQTSKYTTPLQKYTRESPDVTRLRTVCTHPGRHQQSSPRPDATCIWCSSAAEICSAGLTSCTAGSLFSRANGQAPAVLDASGFPKIWCCESAQLAAVPAVSKRQDLLHACVVLQGAAPLQIHGQRRNAGRIPHSNTYQACCSPGREADARSPWGGLCIQPWAFVLVSQVFPLNEAWGRGKSQPSIFPVANVMPGKNSHFHSALADLGLGFISAPLNYKRKTPFPQKLC